MFPCASYLCYRDTSDLVAMAACDLMGSWYKSRGIRDLVICNVFQCMSEISSVVFQAIR